MSTLTKRMRHTVTISTPADWELESNVNEYGDQDEAALTYYDTYQARALIVPRGSSEDDTDRDTQTQVFEMYVQPGTRITGNSTVRFLLEENREVLARVIGEPVIWASVTRGLSHKVAQIEVVEG